MRRSNVGWLVTLSVLACAMTLPAVQAQAYTAKIEPFDECHATSQAAMAALEFNLSPTNRASVRAGAPVAFSGSSAAPLTFAVASSPAALSSPNIDSGAGSL